MICLNCGQVTGPRFCGHCGQAVDDHRSPLFALSRELVEESLSLDGRAVRTIVALPHPGRLTRRYLDGKRVAFVGPFRLYLLAKLALFSSVLALHPPSTSEINLYVAREPITVPPTRGRLTLRIVEPSDKATQWMVTRYAGKFADLRSRSPQELVNRLFEQLRSVLPVALLQFVPILALALKLLYRRSRVLYVDHPIFGVHFQSALFLAFVATWLLMRVAQQGLLVSLVAYITAFLVMITVYLARSLHRVYGQRWGVTIANTAALIMAYFSLLQPVDGVAVFLVLWRL